MSNSDHTSLCTTIHNRLASSDLFRSAVLLRCGIASPTTSLPRGIHSTWKDLGDTVGQVSDIFLSCETTGGERIGIHGKIVRRTSNLDVKRAPTFHDRAAAMAADLEYGKSCCVIFAPEDWLAGNQEAGAWFDARVGLPELLEIGKAFGDLEGLL